MRPLVIIANHMLRLYAVKVLPAAFAVCIVMLLFVGCGREKAPEAHGIVSWSSRFDSELSCVSVAKDGRTVIIGTEDGKMFINENEELRSYRVGKGKRILKADYLFERDGVSYYLLSIRYNGLHVVGIKGDEVVSRGTISMERDAPPYKDDRYSAYDWSMRPDSTYIFATSNGVWHAKINSGTKPSALQRVGNMGKHKMQYAVSSLCYFHGKVYYTAQDGLWCHDGTDGAEPRRVTDDEAKYNSVDYYDGGLIALSGLTKVFIDSAGGVGTSSNDAFHSKFVFRANDSVVYAFANNKLYMNDTELTDLPITRYTKNAFAISRRENRTEGIYTIDGKEVRYTDLHSATPGEQSVHLLALCGSASGEEAYAIDRAWDLYRITPAEGSRRVGHIEGMRTEISAITADDENIYAASLYSLYKIPLRPSLITGKLKAENLNIFSGKPSLDTQLERMMALHLRGGHIIIGTRAHVWRYEPQEPVGADNPMKINLMIKPTPDATPISTDDAYEPANVQFISTHPDSNNPDLLVATRDFGIFSFDPASPYTMKPEDRIGLNRRGISDVRSIDGIHASGTVRLAVAAADSVYLATFRPDRERTMHALPFAAASIAFATDTTLFAIAHNGGFDFISTAADTLTTPQVRYSRLHFLPDAVALGKGIVIARTNSSVYSISQSDGRPTALMFYPDRSGMWLYIIIALASVAAIAMLYITARAMRRIYAYRAVRELIAGKCTSLPSAPAFAGLASAVASSAIAGRKRVSLSEQTRRYRKLYIWWQEDYTTPDEHFDQRLSQLLAGVPKHDFAFDDELYRIREDQRQYTAYTRIVADNPSWGISAKADYMQAASGNGEAVEPEKLVSRMSALASWQATAGALSPHTVQAIAELVKHRLSAKTEFRETLRSISTVHDNHVKMSGIHTALPPEFRIAPTHDDAAMAHDIIQSLQYMQTETRWTERAIAAYEFLVTNEQKIGRQHPETWDKLMKKFVATELHDEIRTVLRGNKRCDYSIHIFAALPSPYHLSALPHPLPVPPIVSTPTDIVINAESIYSALQSWHRAETSQAFAAAKAPVEEALCRAFRTLVAAESRRADERTNFPDYFKNILTYIYYTIFITDGLHMLGYNAKERKYEPLADYRHIIIALSSFAAAPTAEADRADLRPQTIIDKLYLNANGTSITEADISKYKDKTKTLHVSFHKKTAHPTITTLITHLLSCYPSLHRMYATTPGKLLK